MLDLNSFRGQETGFLGRPLGCVLLLFFVAFLSTPVFSAGETPFSGAAPDVPALIKAGETPRDAVRDLIKEGINHWAKVESLSVVFTRRELLDGKTRRGDAEVILVRERIQPHAIYMKWLDGPGKDRELAYVPARAIDSFTVTPGGAVRWLVVEREFNNPEVLAVSRHSPADAGIGHLLHLIDDQFRISVDDSVVVYLGEAVVGGRACYRFIRFLPEKSAPNGTRYYCWKLDLCIDKEMCLPVSVKCYGWKRQFDWQKEPFEDYVYTDFVFNRNLGDDSYQLRKSDQ